LAGLKKLPPIVGYDADSKGVKNAVVNLERVGLRGFIHFERREFCRLCSPSQDERCPWIGGFKSTLWRDDSGNSEN